MTALDIYFFFSHLKKITKVTSSQQMFRLVIFSKTSLWHSFHVFPSSSCLLQDCCWHFAHVRKNCDCLRSSFHCVYFIFPPLPCLFHDYRWHFAYVRQNCNYIGSSLHFTYIIFSSHSLIYFMFTSDILLTYERSCDCRRSSLYFVALFLFSWIQQVTRSFLTSPSYIPTHIRGGWSPYIPWGWY